MADIRVQDRIHLVLPRLDLAETAGRPPGLPLFWPARMVRLSFPMMDSKVSFVKRAGRRDLRHMATGVPLGFSVGPDRGSPGRALLADGRDQ